MITIGIIEDEEDLLELLEFTLKKKGFDVVGFLNTKNVKKFIQEENPDLLIVDRNLPDIEGSIFVEEIKKEGYNIPVIYLTAKVDDNEVLEGFNRGADDYIRKPFNMDELVARINAVLKRYNLKTNTISYKNYHLDLEHKILSYEGNKTILTPSEFKILKFFFENQKRVVSREEIMERFEINNEKSVNVAINRLNHKINFILENVRGIGYKLK